MNNQSRDIDLEQQIDAYIKGQLSDEEAKQLWVQLMKNPEYISLLQTELDLSRICQEESEAEGKTTYYWKWIASAAAVILLVITINVLSTNEHKPIGKWSEKSIALADNLSSAEVTRSESSIDPADSLLNSGFRAAIADNPEEAIRIYQDVVANYEESDILSKAHLNLGILQYNSGEYRKSIQSFKKAVALAQNNTLLKERAYWYMGNAYINTKQLKEARSAVHQTYSLGQIYKDEAFKLLKRLDYELGNIDFDNFQQQIQESE